MAKTAVALYQTLNEARHVVEELAEAGYSRDDIQVMAQDNSNNLATLVKAGLPQADAEAYCESLRHDAHLVLVTTPDDMIDAAIYVMDSYNSINIHDHHASWQGNKTSGHAAEVVHDSDAVRQEIFERDRAAAEPRVVEEGIRYEEYQDEPGEVRAQAEVETPVEEKITPRQDYVEESLRR